MGGRTAGTLRATTLDAPEVRREPEEAPRGADVGRRRFTIAVLIALAASAVVYLYFLWGPWETANPLRITTYEDNFYDLQARAMFHGHLWLPHNSLGIEGWVHDGRTYTYFGLFPSLLRMPILLATSSLDGKLTASSMLLAWVVAAVFTCLLLWRIRLFVRGPVVMGRGEAASYGLLVAVIMAGSVLVYLAATPYVFDEDLTWSVALTIGSVFALLGVLEKPSWGRVAGAGVLILAANLDRVTTGWACVVGAVLTAVWFGVGRGGSENRRWWAPLFAVGVVPLALGCAVNWAKFGIPVGLPVPDQVWSHVNAYRRQFLAANGNSEVGPQFATSDTLAYLRPDGLRFTSVFPFITLPAAPARALSGILFDRRYRTASMPASMLLLFLLSCWGVITAFRRRPVGRVGLTRILMAATAVAGVALLFWGYIATRYLADFVPFLVLASAVGLVEFWRRATGLRAGARRIIVAAIALAGLFSIAANVGISITPNEEWVQGQVLNYVQAQKAVSDVTGHPLNGRVVRGDRLPLWAPADQLFVVGNCDGLYVSNGEDYRTVPMQQFQRATWMAAERGPGFSHTLALTFNRAVGGPPRLAPLVSIGDSTLYVVTVPGDKGTVRVSFWWQDPRFPGSGTARSVQPGSTHQVVVVTDPADHVVQVSIGGSVYLSHPLSSSGPVVVHSQPSLAAPQPVSVADRTSYSPPALCRSLTA